MVEKEERLLVQHLNDIMCMTVGDDNTLDACCDGSQSSSNLKHTIMLPLHVILKSSVFTLVSEPLVPLSLLGPAAAVKQQRDCNACSKTGTNAAPVAK